MCGYIFHLGNDFSKNIDIAEKHLLMRGPDLSKRIINEKNKLLLSHFKLGINKNVKKSQPIDNNDCSMLYNGEIFESESMIKNNSNINFEKTCDLSYFYEIFKNQKFDDLKKINGFWSIIFYDKRRELIYLSRDHIGKKPLFYYIDNEKLIAASTVRAISVKKNKSSIDNLSIAKYLAYGYIPQPRTLYSDINHVKPGTVKIICAKKFKVIKEIIFWKPNFETKYNESTEELKDELKNLISDATKIRTIHNCRNTFISGGLDSSIISYELSKINKCNNYFSLQFNDQNLNEFKKAKYALNEIAIGKTPYSLNLTKSKYSQIKLELNKFNFELISDSSLISSIFMYKALNKFNIKTILTGDGADELFGGYQTMQAAIIGRYFNQIFGKYIKKDITIKSKKNDNSYLPIKFIIQRFLKGTANHNNIDLISPLFLAPLTINQINNFLGTNYIAEEIYSEIFELNSRYQNFSYKAKILIFYFELFLKNQTLVKVDSTSMTNGIEARSPFLDYRIIEFANKLSPDLKFNLFNNKIFLKEIYVKYINKKIIYQKKQGLSGYHNSKKKIPKTFFSNSSLKYKNNAVDRRLVDTSLYNLESYIV
jgi:asparagine synthase (glutamine-hydrolysing)